MEKLNNVNENENKNLTFAQYEQVTDSINKFIAHELIHINNLAISQEPYQQVQILIHQALLLLYRERYTEYLTELEQQTNTQDEDANYVQRSSKA
jgi:hypothetical protein